MPNSTFRWHRTSRSSGTKTDCAVFPLARAVRRTTNLLTEDCWGNKSAFVYPSLFHLDAFKRLADF
jgi:hypothetical protein